MDGCELSSESQGLIADGTVDYRPKNDSMPLRDAFCAAKLLLSIGYSYICNENQKEECRVYNKFSRGIDIRPGARGTLIASKRVAPTS